MLSPIELILKKRNGQQLTKREITTMVQGYIDGSIPDYQMSSFLMAIYFSGMDKDEIQHLTESYIESGKTILFPEGLETVDKHSTGGIGDKISIILAPLVAKFGAVVPMISGRGLGHTGGTLDKLESIPGFRTDLKENKFRKIIDDVGFSIISQSHELVPADRKIYALRDVTGTVESLPLITASIISKKIAEGAKNLVIDLKVGSGAFIKDAETAKKLGHLLKSTGERLGQKVEIVYTNMNSPLGKYIGNALEIKECIEYLSGESIPDIDEINLHLAGRMLSLSGHHRTSDVTSESLRKRIDDGSVLEKLAQFISAQGGNSSVCEDTKLLPQSKYTIPIIALNEGWVAHIKCVDLGYALLNINAGRKTLSSKIDHSTGALLRPKVGDYLKKGEEIGLVYCNDESAGKFTAGEIAKAYITKEEEHFHEDLILEI